MHYMGTRFETATPVKDIFKAAYMHKIAKQVCVHSYNRALYRVLKTTVCSMVLLTILIQDFLSLL